MTAESPSDPPYRVGMNMDNEHRSDTTVILRDDLPPWKRDGRDLHVSTVTIVGEEPNVVEVSAVYQVGQWDDWHHTSFDCLFDELPQHIARRVYARSVDGSRVTIPADDATWNRIDGEYAVKAVTFYRSGARLEAAQMSGDTEFDVVLECNVTDLPESIRRHLR